MEEKPRKKFHISTKSGKSYSVVADYLKYKPNKDEDGMIFFKKEIPDQVNDYNTNVWDVAFIKASDIEIVGIETFIQEDPIPVSNEHIVKEISKALIKVALGVTMFLLTRRLTHVQIF